MSILNPNASFLTTKERKNPSHPAGLKIHDVTDNIVGGPKKLSNPSNPTINGLCSIGRQLSGGRVPRFIQDATPKLYQHLWKGNTKNCQLCEIPIGPPLNSEVKAVESKLQDIIGLNRI